MDKLNSMIEDVIIGYMGYCDQIKCHNSERKEDMTRKMRELHRIRYSPFYEIVNCGSENNIVEMVNYGMMNGDKELRHFVSIESACMGGDEKIIKRVEEYSGEKLSGSDLYGACYGGNVNVINKAMKNAFTSQCDDGLRGACAKGDMKIIKLILKKAKNMDYGLYGACYGGHKEIMMEMMKRGAKDLDEALYWAGRGGQTDIAMSLIKMGARVYSHNFVGVCQSGNKVLIEIMRALYTGNTNEGLFWLCAYGAKMMTKEQRTSITQSLLGSAGISGNERIRNMQIENLCCGRQKEVIQYLAKMGKTSTHTGGRCYCSKVMREIQSC